MRKLKLYIETSTWNFFFADDAPEKMEITKRIEIVTPMEVGNYED